MAQYSNPKIVTDGLAFNLDTLGGRGPNKIITKPTQVGNCILWLDAGDKDSIVESSNLVSSWLDKSGEGNHAAQATSTNQPTYTAGAVNGKATLSFDGTDNHMDIAGLSGTTFGSNGGVTIFMVARQPVFDNTGAGFYFGGQSGDPTTQNYLGAGTSGGDSMDFRMYGGSGTGAEVATFYQDTLRHNIHVGLWDKTNVSIYFNGKQGGTTTSNVTSSNWTTDEAAKIGESAGGAYTNMHISEIILFNRNLSDAERQQVELYLSRKWNIVIQTQPKDYVGIGTIPVLKYGKLDQVGNALYFTGGPNATGGYKDYINTKRVLEPGGTYGSGEAFSLEAWACSKSPTRDGSQWKTIIGSSSNAQINFYGASTVRFMKNGGGNGGSNKCFATTQLHQWHHIVGTFAGGTSTTYSGDIATGPDLRKLYVDGELVDSDKETFYGGNITENYIGSYHTLGLERGPMELAVARIYKKELSHAEIKQNYNAQKARIDAMPKIPAPANLQLYLDAGLWESYKGTGSGNTVVDLSGQGNNGTLTNGTTYDTTLPENDMGKAFDFDGSDDYIEVGDAGTLDITGDMTISCWVKMSSSQNGNLGFLVNKRDSSDSTTPYTMLFDDRGGGGGTNRFRWYMGNGSSQTVCGDDSNFDGVYGVWTHVVGTVSGTAMTIYVNGVAKNTATFSGSRQTNGVSVKIGGPYTHGGDNFMIHGSISVVTIQNTALSAVQVQQLYDYFKHRYGK